MPEGVAEKGEGAIENIYDDSRDDDDSSSDASSSGSDSSSGSSSSDSSTSESESGSSGDDGDDTSEAEELENEKFELGFWESVKAVLPWTEIGKEVRQQSWGPSRHHV